MFVNGHVTNSEHIITQNYKGCMNARHVLWLMGAGFSWLSLETLEPDSDPEPIVLGPLSKHAINQ